MTEQSGKLHIAVLVASHAESQGELKAVEEGYEITPAHFFAPRWPPADKPDLKPCADESPYTFETIHVHKRTAYRQVRDAVKSGRFACFFNLCDGAKDEDRAGVEVLQALEEFQVPYTGASSTHYEPSKNDMKKLVHYHGVRTARGCIVRSAAAIRSKCEGLTFPVIVKHPSGYSSVGMTRRSKCATMAELEEVAGEFIMTYECALIEEFVDGDEATVLACSDPSQPNGVRVYPPVKMRFPEGEDFKHFDLKWNSYDDIAWYPMDAADPAFERVKEVGAVAFANIMDGIGYGRSDVRIDRHTGEVVFLELNPNCGIMYQYGDEGSADWILRLAGANGQGHRDFVDLQIRAAIARARRNRPLFECVLDFGTNSYVLEALEDIPEGRVVFEDEGRPTRLYTHDYVTNNWTPAEQQLFRENAWPMGCDQHVYAVWDKEPERWRPVMHSCDPNMRFVDNRSLNVAAVRKIKAGDRLTMDYRTFMDAMMPPFDCRCKSSNCSGRIYLDQRPGFLAGTEEGKAIDSFHRTSPSRLSAHLALDSASSRSNSPLQPTA